MAQINTKEIEAAGFFDKDKVRSFSETARDKGFSRQQVKEYIGKNRGKFRVQVKAAPVPSALRFLPGALKDEVVGGGTKGLRIAGQSVQDTSSAFYKDILANAARLGEKGAAAVSPAFGLPKGEPSGIESLFRMGREQAERTAENLAVRPEDRITPTTTTEKVIAGVGAAPLTLGTYAAATALTGNPMAGMAAVDALRASDKGLKETIVGGIKGAALGGILHATSPLRPLARSSTVGGLFGGQAALEGGDPSDIASSTIVGAGLGLLGPKGKVTGREAIRSVIERARPLVLPRQARAAAKVVDLPTGRGVIREPTLLEESPASARANERIVEAERQPFAPPEVKLESARKQVIAEETTSALEQESPPLIKDAPASSDPLPAGSVQEGVAPPEVIPVRSSPLTKELPVSSEPTPAIAEAATSPEAVGRLAESIRKAAATIPRGEDQPIHAAFKESAGGSGKIQIARPKHPGAEMEAYNALPISWKAGNKPGALDIDIVMQEMAEMHPDVVSRFRNDPNQLVDALKAERQRTPKMTVAESERLAIEQIETVKDLEAARSPEQKAFDEVSTFFDEKRPDRPFRESPLTALQNQEGFVRLPGAAGEVRHDIRERVQPKDVLPTSEFIMSPERVFKSANVRPSEWEPGERLSAQIIEKSQEYAYQSETDKIWFDQMRKPLSESEQRLMTKVLRGEIEPEGVPEKVLAAGREVREYKNEIREEFKTYKREMFKRYLTEEENQALSRVIDGREDVELVAKQHKVDASVMDEIATEFRDIDNWGIEDYVTNMERGTFRMVDNDGTTVLVGLSRNDAKRKAISYMDRHPEVKTLTLETGFSTDANFAALLPRIPALRLRQQIADLVGADAKVIQQQLREAGVRIAVKPTAKFAGPTQRRHGILEGEENLFDVLPAYSYAMRKKMKLDPVLADARTELHTLPKNQRTAMERLLEEAKGRKTVFDNAADDILNRFGVSAKPFAFSGATGKLGKATAWMKLGYRPVAGAVNLASGQAHTWVSVGTKYTAQAAKFLRTPEGKAFAAQEAPHLGITFAQDSSIEHQASRTPLHHPLGLFQKAEPINRKMSLAANYLYAKDAYGMPEAEARVFARRSMRFQQFTYDIASLPRIMRGPSGRLIFKFKPYLVKELEFISSLRGPEIPRYIAAQLALGGPRAFIYTLKTIPVLGALGLLDDVDDWLNQNAPRASRGVGGFAGVDVTAPVTFQFPQKAEDWLGPTLSDMIRLYKNVYVPIAQGEGRTEGLAVKELIKTVPAMHNWSMLVDTVMDDENWIRDYGGRKLHQATGADRVKLIFGARPLKLSVQQAAQREILREERTESKTRARALEAAAAHVIAKEPIPQELLDEMIELGVTRESLTNAVKQRVLTPKQRLLRQVGKRKRVDVLERFPGQ